MLKVIGNILGAICGFCGLFNWLVLTYLGVFFIGFGLLLPLFIAVVLFWPVAAINGEPPQQALADSLFDSYAFWWGFYWNEVNLKAMLPLTVRIFRDNWQLSWPLLFLCGFGSYATADAILND